MNHNTHQNIIMYKTLCMPIINAQSGYCLYLDSRGMYLMCTYDSMLPAYLFIKLSNNITPKGDPLHILLMHRLCKTEESENYDIIVVLKII